VELTFDRATPGTLGKNDDEENDDDDVLNIHEATERSFSVDMPKDMRDSALEYELKLYNGASVRALIYLVYAEPLGTTTGGGGAKSGKNIAATGKNAAGFSSASGNLVDRAGHTWLPVTRGRCAKGCSGPILSAIQRFGKQGRTQKGGAKDAGAAAKEREEEEAKKGDEKEDKWKDARNLFISIDEASNHVCNFGPNKCKVFRCVSPPSPVPNPSPASPGTSPVFLVPQPPSSLLPTNNFRCLPFNGSMHFLCMSFLHTIN
jgi:hypothetical protein